MDIAIFGKTINHGFVEVIKALILQIKRSEAKIYIYKPFHQVVSQLAPSVIDGTLIFDDPGNMPKSIKFMMCIGGDGTMLEAITFVKDTGIPLIGFNAGRLGFLANISEHEAEHAIQHLLAGEYEIEERSILKFGSEQEMGFPFPYAFNECTIQKTGSSLITIHAQIDNRHLNSYWADGLIISTPSGSTAYSLSVGGPIVSPDSKNFIISPIAAHNLNVRPLVIPDDSKLTFTIEGRTNRILVSLDSKSGDCNINNKITISKAEFSIRMIKLHNINFYATLRNKLLWGHDKRN